MITFVVCQRHDYEQCSYNVGGHNKNYLPDFYETHV
jgi:hypothetical protein